MISLHIGFYIPSDISDGLLLLYTKSRLESNRFPGITAGPISLQYHHWAHLAPASWTRLTLVSPLDPSHSSITHNDALGISAPSLVPNYPKLYLCA